MPSGQPGAINNESGWQDIRLLAVDHIEQAFPFCVVHRLFLRKSGVALRFPPHSNFLITKFFLVGPESEGGIANVENLLAVGQHVEAVL